VDAEPRLRLRGHHLLCVFGFRGLGYSPGFVRNMRAVVDAFFGRRGARVEIAAGCDDICAACPHARDGVCARGGESVDVRDGAVLARLRLAVGDGRPAAGLARVVAARVAPEALGELCAGCEWLTKGYCAEGLRDRRELL